MNSENTAIILINGYRQERVLVEKTIGTDAQGRPIVELQAQNGFDGMTGQPIYMPVVHCGFDPSSGRPMYEPKNAQFEMPQPNAQYGMPQSNAQYEMPQSNAQYGMPQSNAPFGMPQSNAPFGMPQSSMQTPETPELGATVPTPMSDTVPTSDTVPVSTSDTVPTSDAVAAPVVDMQATIPTADEQPAQASEPVVQASATSDSDIQKTVAVFSMDSEAKPADEMPVNGFGTDVFGKQPTESEQPAANLDNNVDANAYSQNSGIQYNGYANAYGQDANNQYNGYANAYGQDANNQYNGYANAYGQDANNQYNGYANAYGQDANNQYNGYANAYGQDANNQYNSYANSDNQNNAGYGNGYTQAGGKAKAKKKASGGKGLIIALVAVVAVVVCGLLAFAGIKSGMFLSARNKVALATYKTAMESTLVESVVEAGKIADNEKLTTEISGNVNVKRTTVDVRLTTAQDMSAGKIGVDGKIEVGGMIEQSVEAYYDDEKIQLALPDLSDDVIEYNYKEKNRGFIADTIAEETYGDIEDVNNILIAFSDIYKDNGKYRKELTKQMLKAYKDVEVNKIDSKSFEVNGKDHKCKGYEFVITPSNLRYFINAYSEATDKTYGESMDLLFDSIANLTDEDINFKDMTSELTDEVGDFDDIILEFYIYKGKLAAIETDIEGTELSIQFLGGDTRISTIELIAKEGSNKDKAVINIKNKKGKEEAEFIVDNETVIEYSYNAETGKITVSAAGEELSGTFQVDKGKRVKAGISGGFDGMSLDYDITIEKGAKIKELDGDIFDIGNADEDDIKDFVMDIISEIDGLSALGNLSNIFSGTDYAAPAAEAPVEEEFDFDLDDFDY